MVLPALTPHYRDLVELLGLVSVLTFVGSLLAIPWLIGRLPVDYFIQHRRKVEERHKQHPLAARIIFVVRNGFGTLFLLAGIAMLLLPGQGIITILIGISLMDFPRKHLLVDALIRRPRVAKTLNWLRRKQNKTPFAL
ncbi:MAG: hypothetical protein C4563_03505 [Desulfobulbus sp.]|jgi:hypothetical protein|nr:MAG: hypothetical protein C4563_03505 [Desulfobulbus sp.]